MNITVLGAGAWGTALAHHLASRHSTLLWARAPALVEQLAHDQQNKVYLPGVRLASALRYEADLAASLQYAAAEDALCIIATPVAGLRAMCKTMRELNCIPARLIWLCKGFEVATRCLPHQVVAAELGEHRSCGALSGPSFAREVAQGLPVALTIASQSAACRDAAVRAFHHAAMRIYTADDVIGVEIGGAVKNVLAIAAGIADGLGFGFNARAALITRGLAEMTRLGMALGARAETFMGLAGLGDLILTATGDLSRNRTVGLQLAQGRSLDQILASLGHIAEGVRCAPEVLALAHARAVEMPVTQAVCSVLFDGCAPHAAAEALLQRAAKVEASLVSA
ncbi:NAD(P)H-dependent glycerol-3-phosphate dehydrogenase [Mycoavidus cysteinexigens]|uniref:Glycerol-3-phosphate dehydrogenase [NAD(P)+] n=1 Tax=Mycoavidus cysteinexigens TaxID=1553431 RepID=A0A2Z6EY05_9BURK|nr:NAD(P)H-dependent glycerol-3-phosphate dehydrogenase [Mycoavidus cysteinexigens]BBE10297.1 NAD(P)H-dependent glycerol-3-phosphate dehydrogenase [Mycoavidus cysteinexigens]GAM53332.1 glycerol-3-phosphate dehydrogenase [bacterium endosymbiont of Mortierella elongata FMR23-6]GLR00714.1 glycerol-3-phosphate dehydrogenase [NAD(P)+] [Mycoavidus cysteinexigens]